MHLNELFLEKDQCPSEDWTHDRWFTRPALCHWAIEATASKSRIPSRNCLPRVTPVPKTWSRSFKQNASRCLQWVVYYTRAAWNPSAAVSPQNCPQWGLNSRPLVYETSALPLSCRGDRKAMDSVPFRLLSQTSIPLSRLILPTLLDDPRTREALSSVPTNGTQANGT